MCVPPPLRARFAVVVGRRRRPQCVHVRRHGLQDERRIGPQLQRDVPQRLDVVFHRRQGQLAVGPQAGLRVGERARVLPRIENKGCSRRTRARTPRGLREGTSERPYEGVLGGLPPELKGERALRRWVVGVFDSLCCCFMFCVISSFVLFRRVGGGIGGALVRRPHRLQDHLAVGAQLRPRVLQGAAVLPPRLRSCTSAFRPGMESCIRQAACVRHTIVVYRSGWKWAIATLCPISSHFCESLLAPFRG